MMLILENQIDLVKNNKSN